MCPIWLPLIALLVAANGGALAQKFDPQDFFDRQAKLLGILSLEDAIRVIAERSQDAPPEQQDRPPNPAGGQQEQAGTKDSKPPPGPSATAEKVGQDKTARSSDPSTSKDWSKIFLDHLPDWFVALFTMVLSVFTGLLWWSTDKLWKVTNATLEHARDDAARQASEMKASITAATRANELTTRALIATDRPWVAVRAGIVAPLVFAGGHIRTEIEFILQNFGKSPAANVSFDTELCVTLADALERAEFYIGNLRRNRIGEKGTFGEGEGPALFPGETLSVKKSFSANRHVFLEAIQTDDPFIDPSLIGKGFPVALIVAYYLIPNAEKMAIPRFTTYMARIFPADPKLAGFDGTEGRFQPVDVVLNPVFRSGEIT